MGKLVEPNLRVGKDEFKRVSQGGKGKSKTLSS